MSREQTQDTEDGLCHAVIGPSVLCWNKLPCTSHRVLWSAKATLVERLRNDWGKGYGDMSKVSLEAADALEAKDAEIERLRAENTALKVEIENLKDDLNIHPRFREDV